MADPALAGPGVYNWNSCVRVVTDVSRHLSVGFGL